ncbi:hypothetical protein SLE2022_138080 [Rubroshorea leprosula]
MEYQVSDSSGTGDDVPPSHQNIVSGGGYVSGNGRSVVGLAPYFRMQYEMEAQIHQLEQEAYCAVLRAFRAQFDAITWEKEGLITELRKELRVSDDEHRELLSKVNAVNLQSYVAFAGRGQGSTKGLFRKEYMPSQNSVPKRASEDIELLDTQTLVKEVEKVFDASHLDPLELEKAKKKLKEHELALIDTLARLADASDGERDGEQPSLHAQ